MIIPLTVLITGILCLSNMQTPKTPHKVIIEGDGFTITRTTTEDEPLLYIHEPALLNTNMHTSEPIARNRVVNNIESGLFFENPEDAEKVRKIMKLMDESWEEMMRGAPEDELGMRLWNAERFPEWSEKIIAEIEKIRDREGTASAAP